MDTSSKINQYAQLILALLSEQATLAKNPEEYQRIVVADRENHHYQLMATGWISPSRYVDNLLVHVHIKPDGKVWLLENNTEIRVAEELVTLGVPKSDIVLGFHPPQYRDLTGYAVA